MLDMKGKNAERGLREKGKYQRRGWELGVGVGGGGGWMGVVGPTLEEQGKVGEQHLAGVLSADGWIIAAENVN